MGRKLPNTPRSRVRSALRRLFLRSRERAACLKASGYKCAQCGIKQSRKKGGEVYVEVHHSHGIGNWDKVIDAIYEELLCNPNKMEVLCVTCHDKETELQTGKKKTRIKTSVKVTRPKVKVKKVDDLRDWFK